ncbi:MAG: hypothetical protein LBE80_01860 [Deltaproteobacteria bacterium]|jgi:hypothetical protein|nr:hypothetical protein [Deltaproteobacteria bacterium]
MGNLARNSPGLAFKKGFTVLELIVVVVMVIIVGAMVYGNMNSYLSDSRLRGEAKRLEEFLWRAKLLADESKRPVRVVLDCSQAKRSECYLSLQSGLVDKSTVTGWTTLQDGFHLFHEKVKATLLASLDKGQDGDKRIKDLYYGIFMPDQKVYSDPKPFEIFLFYSKNQNDSKKVPTNGYRISISRDNGRISLVKESQVI